MSGIAEIFDAQLNPGKEEVARTHGGVATLLGSYRLVDTVDGEVGIEVLIGRDAEDRLVQLPLSYRSTEIDPAQTLTRMEHSVLGQRWVSNALGDPVAVREFIRTILSGDDGATYSNGDTPLIDIRGAGTTEDGEVELGEVELTTVTSQSVSGTLLLNGRIRAFTLRLPRLLGAKKSAGADHDAARLHLHGSSAAAPGQTLRVAELFWRDL